MKAKAEIVIELVLEDGSGYTGRAEIPMSDEDQQKPIDGKGNKQ